MVKGFDLRPKIWLHYLLLAIFIMFIITPIINANQNLPIYTIIIAGLSAITLSIGIFDQILHALLGVD